MCSLAIEYGIHGRSYALFYTHMISYIRTCHMTYDIYAYDILHTHIPSHIRVWYPIYAYAILYTHELGDPLTAGWYTWYALFSYFFDYAHTRICDLIRVYGMSYANMGWHWLIFTCMQIRTFPHKMGGNGQGPCGNRVPLSFPSFPFFFCLADRQRKLWKWHFFSLLTFLFFPFCPPPPLFWFPCGNVAFAFSLVFFPVRACAHKHTTQAKCINTRHRLCA